MPKTVRKPIIAVDVDDVLGDFNESLRHFINREYGHNHSPEDYSVEGEYWGYWGPIWGVESQEYRDRMHNYLDSGQLLRQKLLPNAKKVLTLLQKNYDLVIITSREDKSIDQTKQWLKEHFKTLFNDVHFAKVWNKGEKAEKAEICQAIGASYLIDDNVEHCNLAAEASVQALLFGDYGWQKNRDLHTGVVKVKDWPAVLEYFEHERS